VTFSSIPPGFTLPAEWAPHRACWLAWPSHPDLWLEDLEPARQSFVELCRAIADINAAGMPQGEALEILVPDEHQEQAGRRALGGLPARWHRILFGDIWLRDTGPLFLQGPTGRATVRFRFNGWGDKYLYAHDPEVAAAIAARVKLPAFPFPFVLEGGSIEVDGEGTLLTTRQCLLNPNRNPGADEAQLERWLRDALGVERVLWLDQGLQNDHTDGHIDTLARFVRPGAVVCMAPAGKDDPNTGSLEAIARALSAMRDARGRKLEVIRIPSPGRVLGADRQVMPASYLNYYLGNRVVAVPTYGASSDAAAVAALSSLFPQRRTVGIPAKSILSGGGAFHCITQQEPQ
jgi:agmatine deiminase